MSKRLILRGREHADAGVDARHENADPDLDAQPRLSRPRSPSGHPGLPCDRLFALAAEPVILLEASTRRVVQANPAVTHLLGISEGTLIGCHVVEAFDASSTEALMRAIDAAHSEEAMKEVTCRAAKGGEELSAAVSLFRAEKDKYFLIRLQSSAGRRAQAVPRSPVFEAIEHASVGFLLTDAGLRIEYANQAFLDMVELAPPAEICGKSLVRWLELSDADLATLRDQMLHRQATSVRVAPLRTERSRQLDVEVHAVAVPDGPHVCWGFTIRELPRLN